MVGVIVQLLLVLLEVVVQVMAVLVLVVDLHSGTGSASNGGCDFAGVVRAVGSGGPGGGRVGADGNGGACGRL